MTRLSVALILLIGMFGIVSGQDFYDINTINTVEIIFQESNWDQILDSYYAAGDEERLVGTAIINGVQYDSVGVRYKGNSTYQANETKNPLNIKLDHIIDGQTINGYGTLKLANCWHDPSFVRETLSYEIARKYMPASQANYIEVSINGLYLGLYTSVQSVDKFFLNNHFYCNDNTFVKGEMSSMAPHLETIWGYAGEDSTQYYDLYEMKSDSGYAELIDFFYDYNYNTSIMEDILDVDRHLWMLAYDNLLVNLDAPINMCHNFYLYKDATAHFNPIIWDLNMAFGGFTNIVGGSNLDVTGLQHLTPYLNISSSYFPIITKVLNIDTYKKMYVAHIKTMIEENFSNGWYLTRAYELQAIIDTAVQNDPNKFYTYSAFINNITSSVGNNSHESIVGLSQLMGARVTYLNSLADFTATPPSITDFSNSPATPSSGGTVWFSADVSGATSVIMGYRQNVAEQFEKVTMYDDGAHNDGSSGDGVYGVSITLGSGDLQYYFYAEDSDAGIFSPARAEYEYHLLDVIEVMDSDLYINEFMADNDGVIADQDSEYEDWVELYNSSETAINLNGYYLSDDLVELDKWAFPDTTIAAGGFLLIWADEDLTQEGLHADFKLSKSGESIVLSDPSLNILDQITFGAQTTDISYGRYPDGADNWQTFDIPTPGASNVGTSNTPPEFGWILYSPNPPASSEQVDVMAVVSDQEGLSSVILYYDAGSGYQSVTMYDDGSHGDSLSADGIYGGSIPAQADLTVVNFYIEAVDNASETVSNPDDPGERTYRYYVMNTHGTLYVNEFMADNDNTIMDPDGSGDYVDWIEIHNSGTGAVDLGGMYLTDNLDDPTQWQIPSGVTVPAGGYLLFWADNNEAEGSTHTNFKLSADGEAVGLFDTDANSNAAVDVVTFGLQTTDVSEGRAEDGNSIWQFFDPASPEASNGPTSNTPPEFGWILYSPNPPTSSEQVDVTVEVIDPEGMFGVTIYYNLGGGNQIVEMYDDGAHNDSEADDGIYGGAIPAQADLSLVEFYIEAIDNASVTIYYPENPGDRTFQYYVMDSHGPLYINEFMSDNDNTIIDPDGSGGYPDWLEIYNSSTSAIDLGGMYLTDDLDDPFQWQIPAGVTIPAGGFLLFWADNDEPQGSTHTNFKLSNDGEAIGLYDTDLQGNAVLDIISFGLQYTDVSQGRSADGGTTWQFFSVATPGATNSAAYLCGDANADGVVNVSDAVRIINYVFIGGAAPDPLASGDANCDTVVNVSDAVKIINYVFIGGYAPCDSDGDGNPDC